MTRRRLSEEDKKLWKQVADKTEPLHQSPPQPFAKPKPSLPDPVAPRKIDPFALGQSAKPQTRTNDLAPTLRDRFSAAPVHMDRKAYGRMKRGKLEPDGRIDLHGMTLARAHPVLTRFILSSRASGKRLVLVITGKGRDKPDHGPIPTPRGILKHHVPEWLRTPPLSDAVLQIAEAHISHGGAGAYYVYLRKSR